MAGNIIFKPPIFNLIASRQEIFYFLRIDFLGSAYNSPGIGRIIIQIPMKQ
jgi:hypothetical protein